MPTADFFRHFGPGHPVQEAVYPEVPHQRIETSYNGKYLAISPAHADQLIEVLRRFGHLVRRNDSAVRSAFWDPFD